MKTCLIAALSLTLMACAGTTARIEPTRLNEVQKGQTTVAEVVRQFGRPSVLLRNPDGTQSALYVYNEGPSSGTTIVSLVTTVPRDSVTFYFDTKGVLTDLKTTQANAGKPAPAEANPAPAEVNKTTQATANKPAPASSEKPAPASATKTPQGNSNTWSVPGWLPSSSERQRQ
jgi:outer membrane protein assembly factor BamE (lipoprotein component of BamABCDE complex)